MVVRSPLIDSRRPGALDIAGQGRTEDGRLIDLHPARSTLRHLAQGMEPQKLIYEAQKARVRLVRVLLGPFSRPRLTDWGALAAHRDTKGRYRDTNGLAGYGTLRAGYATDLGPCSATPGVGG